MENFAIGEAIFWSTVSKMNLQESKILLSKISILSLAFLMSIVIIKVEFWQEYPWNFQTPLSDFYFSNL